jgi:hypothetical protein
VIPVLAALLLALAAGQVAGADEPPPPPASESAERDADEISPAEPGAEAAADGTLPARAFAPPDPVGLADVLGRSESAADEELRRSRIPFLPSAAAATRPKTGTHLTVGALSMVRTQNVSAQGGLTQWNTDLELDPAIGFYSFGRKAQFSLSYTPRIYFPAVYHGVSPSVLERAIARLDWSPSHAWSLAAWGTAIYGDYSQLVPSSTPGGPGPPPATIQPVRSYSTYPYVNVDVNASAALSVRDRLGFRVAAGWFDVGGLGEAGQAAQPRTWGPRADATVDLFLGRATTLSTTGAATNSSLVGGYAIRVLAGVETWTQRWSAQLETRATLGVAGVNNPPVAGVTVGNLLPVAGLKAVWTQPSHDTIRLVGELGLGPYVDTYLQAAYQRITWRLGAEWYMGRKWKLEGSFAGALVPFTVRAPESYGVLGASATWSPLRWLSILAGGYAQTQLASASTSRFLQLTGYVGVSVLSPDLP